MEEKGKRRGGGISEKVNEREIRQQKETESGGYRTFIGGQWREWTV